MSHKHEKKHSPSDLSHTSAEAQQMIELLELLGDELTGFERFLDMVRLILDRQYENHLRVGTLVNRVRRSNVRMFGEVTALLRDYRAFYGDHAHLYGDSDCPSFQSLLNYSISLGDLLEHFPADRVVKDFLDG